MRRLAEPAAFLALATAVHAGVWVTFGGGGAPDGAGQGGTAPVALAPADETVAAMVRQWEAPPQVAEASPVLAPPAVPDAPSPPIADAPALAAAVPAVPESPALPGADATLMPQSSADRPSPQRPRPRPELPARQAATADKPQPAQRPSGSGARASSGADGAAQAASASPGQLRALEAEWGAAILARVARHQRYPSGARGEGTARVELTVGRDGRVQATRLVGSSGNAGFDRAALEAVRRAGRLPAAPAGLTNASYAFRIPMTFRQN